MEENKQGNSCSAQRVPFSQYRTVTLVYYEFIVGVQLGQSC